MHFLSFSTYCVPRGSAYISLPPPPLTSFRLLSFTSTLSDIQNHSRHSTLHSFTLSTSAAILPRVSSASSPTTTSSPANKVSSPKTTTYYYYPKPNVLDRHRPVYEYITVTRTPSPTTPPLTRASTRTNTPTPRTPTIPMARTASTSPRVSWADVNNIMRPPRDDELSVMRKYANHAAHCSACADPYKVWKTDGELCDRGHAYARDVAKYIYSKGGRPYSVIDKDSRNERNEIEVPVDCAVIRNLTKAFHQGLNLRTKAIVSHDTRYPVSDRRPRDSREDRERTERRYFDSRRGYGVEIKPSSRREREWDPREQRDTRDRSKRASIHVDGSKGSLYYLDEVDKLSRRRYESEPVILLAEPNHRRQFVR